MPMSISTSSISSSQVVAVEIESVFVDPLDLDVILVFVGILVGKKSSSCAA